LTSIGRGLKERTKLENIVERLSRNLSRKDMSKTLNRQLVAAASSKIKDRTLLVVDLSDIQKPYGRSMEYLGRVRDGSSGKIGPGYWNLNVVATAVGSRDVLPLWGELYSVSASRVASRRGFGAGYFGSDAFWGGDRKEAEWG